MTWRGRETALQCHDIQEFIRYLHGLDFSSWKPAGIVLHNTASPNLQQWWHGGTPPAKRMENLRNYYENEMGWSAGPHAFVDGVSIWVMTDFNVKGVHSPSWNGTRLGVEMVGDYNVESDESGEGLKVMNLTVPLFGEVCGFFGWEPNNDRIKLHKEDPATNHDCPGKNVVKSEFLTDVSAYMGEGGDHATNPPPAAATEIEGIVFGLAANDYLNVRAAASSSAPIIGSAVNDDKVIVVGEAYNGSTRWLRARFGDAGGTGIAVYGWCSADYVGLPPKPEAETWHDSITATVFGGVGDMQESAYGGMVDGSKPGVALPYRWRDGRPLIVVAGPKGQIEAPVVDLGPWNIDNPEYVLRGMRPLVEKQYQLRTPAQNGQVPTNDAGIDLTPVAASAVGVSGKGKVRWRIK